MSAKRLTRTIFAAFLLFFAAGELLAADDRAVFPANGEIKNGKKVVLVSGDEEYRTEEYFTALAKILSVRHGFDCVVLYAVDPKTGKIDPDCNTNISGLEELRDADLMVISVRRRQLPDVQMKEFDDFLRRGKPVIGTRTATHAFTPSPESAFFYYADGYDGKERPEWTDGFGRKILGEKWVAHHGHHTVEGTGTLVVRGEENNPFLRAVRRIVVPTDVYRVRLPMKENCRALLYGEVLEGLTADTPPVKNEKNDPLMPVVWTTAYRMDECPEGRAFMTTLGSSLDFLDENFRRLLVNAVYGLCLGDDKIPEKADVDFVGTYAPKMYGMGTCQPQFHVQPKELQ